MGKGGVRERKGGKYRRTWEGGKGEWQDTSNDLIGDMGEEGLWKTEENKCRRRLMQHCKRGISINNGEECYKVPSSGHNMAIVLRHSASEITCTRPEQDQANQHWSMVREGVWEALFLVKELQQVTAAGGRGFIAHWATVDYPCSHEWPYRRLHVCSTSWAQLVWKRKKRGYEAGVVVGAEELRVCVRSKYIVYIYKILDE